MAQYNPNDFYPHAGQEINSAGNTVNPADGVDANGNQGVIINGDKVIGPTLIDTIPFGSFTASTTLTKIYPSVLTRSAKKRTILIANQLNQATSSGTAMISDSVMPNGSKSGYIGGSSMNIASINGSAAFTYGGDANPALLANGDTIQISLAMGATAPTSGNVYIYVTEVF